MGLGELVAAGGELLHRDEALSLALFHGVQRRRLAQSPNGDEGRQQAVLRDFEGGGVGVVDADGIKVEATEIELIAHLQRHHQVLLHSGGILVVLDLPDLLFHGVDTGAAVLGVEGLGPDGEEGGVEGQRPVDLEPCDAEGHHDVGHGVAWEQISDLGQRVDIPLGTLCSCMASTQPS